MISRHISIDDDYISKMRPYVDKNKGNLGAALREIINEADAYNNRTNSLYISLFDWMLKESEGRIVPDSVVDETISPSLINSIKRLNDYVCNKFDKLKWNVEIDIKSDSDNLPSFVNIEIRGSSQKINIIANILSKYLVRHSSERAPLGIESVVSLGEYLRIRLSRMDKNRSSESLLQYFGHMEQILRTIKDRPYFWKSIIEQHISSDFDMVTIHRNFFEDLLTDNIPSGDIMLDILTKKPIQDIPLNKLLIYIKDIYENSRIVDTIDVQNNDMIIYHSYRNIKSAEKLKDILINLLENSGHLYDAKLTSNSIIFRYRPDIDIKIDEIINNLKDSKSGVDQELIMFMTFLNGLKEMDMTPNLLSSSIFLGKNIGISLIQEYEKENNIVHSQWNMEKFKNFLEKIDSKLYRDSELIIDKESVQYIIKKCSIVNIDKSIEPYICSIILEMHKGALNYALGNNATLDIRKLKNDKDMNNGDNYCEVVLRTR